MSLVIPQDFNQKLYQNVIRNIDREKNHNLEAAIDTAEEEIKSYLSRYDIEVLFSATDIERSTLLMRLILDTAVWHFSSISSAQIDPEYWSFRYKEAKKDLEKIQAGKMVPVDWPQLEDPQNVTNKFEVFSTRPQRSVEGL